MRTLTLSTKTMMMQKNRTSAWRTNTTEPKVDIRRRRALLKGRPQSGHVVLPSRLTAKKEDDPEGALKDFNGVVEAEGEKGDWWVWGSQ